MLLNAAKIIILVLNLIILLSKIVYLFNSKILFLFFYNICAAQFSVNSIIVVS